MLLNVYIKLNCVIEERRVGLLEKDENGLFTCECVEKSVEDLLTAV